MLKTATDVHRHAKLAGSARRGVTSPEDLRALAVVEVDKRREAGYTEDIALVVVDAPLVAYINVGRWCGDCECGAGNAVNPEWAETSCLGCGRVHTNIIVPDARTRAAIESVLAQRPHDRNKNWRPGETVEQLQYENVARGFPDGKLAPDREPLPDGPPPDQPGEIK